MPKAEQLLPFALGKPSLLEPPHRCREGFRLGILCSDTNSPASARRKKSITAADVRYCRPQMLTVASQPLRRQRQAVVAVMPASSQNLLRLTIARPSASASIEGVFIHSKLGNLPHHGKPAHDGPGLMQKHE